MNETLIVVIIAVIVILIGLAIAGFELAMLVSQIKKLRADLTTVFEGVLKREDRLVIKTDAALKLLDVIVEATKKKKRTVKEK
jgi:hypothetical protein